jgi:hypothetical protein
MFQYQSKKNVCVHLVMFFLANAAIIIFPLDASILDVVDELDANVS